MQVKLFRQDWGNISELGREEIRDNERIGMGSMFLWRSGSFQVFESTSCGSCRPRIKF